ncbi:MAG: signal recognition particle-docking protein FtsY [Rhizobiaceae bacterium]
MSDKKPGLLKRIFSFGLGSRSATPEPASPDADEKIASATSEDSRIPESNLTADTDQTAPQQPAPPAPVAPVAKTTAAPTKAGTSKSGKSDRQAAGRKPEQPTERRAKKTETPQAAAKSAAVKAPTERPKDKPREEPVVTPSTTAQAKPEAKSDQASPLRGKVQITRPAADSSTSATPSPAPDSQPAGWFARLRKGLSRSSQALGENIASVFTKRKLDEEALQELEDVLIQADLGVETSMRITDALSSRRLGRDVTDEEVRTIMAEEIETVLAPVALPLELDLDHRPHVILVVGVNGSGKTTTIGKLSAKLRDGGFSTLLVAGDTFRAAAIEQLKIWGERTSSPVIARELGADAAGLAYDAWQQASMSGSDVMLMDTAGRLQNRTELMAELEKIIRVLRKQDASAPHTVLLTLDATTGQNALNQVEIFGKVAGVNGLVMTKLDGTARGGILVAISAKHKLPVYFVGVGEGIEDLEPFAARDFARSIAGLPAAGETR